MAKKATPKDDRRTRAERLFERYRFNTMNERTKNYRDTRYWLDEWRRMATDLMNLVRETT